MTYPKLYNSSDLFQATLDNILVDTAKLKQVVNGENTFSFEAYESALKSEYFEPDNYVLVKGQMYDIKYVEKARKKSIKHKVQCEHVFYRLLDGEVNKRVSYAKTGTPHEILTDILDGTEFTAGVVDFTESMTYAVPSEVTNNGLVKGLANTLNGEIEFVGDGRTINIRNTIGANNGLVIEFGKNLLGIKKVIDKRGKLKVSYAVDMIELKNSNAYKHSKLGGLEIVEPGDTVQLIDPGLNINIQNRIISVTSNPILQVNTSIEIANTIELITDKVTKINTLAVKLNELYYNIFISNEYGFRAVSNDEKARVTMNGNEISMERGDGEGNWYKVLYFDAEHETFMFDGKLSADLIESLRAEIDVVVSYVQITNVLAAQKAMIAELTVDSINTSDFVERYKAGNTSPVGYFRGNDQTLDFIEAIYAGGEKQVTDRQDNPLYWADEAKTEVSLDATNSEGQPNEPIMRYIYNGDGDGVVKMSLYHEIDPDTGYANPKIQMGAGYGDGERGKAYIYKDEDGVGMEYNTSDNDKYFIHVGENGIHTYPSVISISTVVNEQSHDPSNELVLEGVGYTSFATTLVKYDGSADITTTGECTVTAAIRVDGEVIKTVEKYYSGAYTDNFPWHGAIPPKTVGEHTVDVVLTASSGTITVPIEKYEMVLLIRGGAAKEVAPYPFANVMDTITFLDFSPVDDSVEIFIDGANMTPATVTPIMEDITSLGLEAMFNIIDDTIDVEIT